MISIFMASICIIYLFLIIPQMWHDANHNYEKLQWLIQQEKMDAISYNRFIKGIMDETWRPSDRILNAAKRWKQEGYNVQEM